MKRITKSLISMGLALAGAVSLPGVALAGWGCSGITKSSVTVGVFQDFSSNVTLAAIFMVLTLVLLCGGVLMGGALLRELKRSPKYRWIVGLGLVLPGLAVPVLALGFGATVVELLATAIWRPTWTQSDTGGQPFSSCSITTYTLHASARVTVVLMALLAVALAAVCIWRQITRTRRAWKAGTGPKPASKP